jgi:site-specific DNA-methyltransferase (adenine-specific)
VENCTLYHGDCIKEMAKLESNSVDAIICDPPYGLEFMGKDWDSFGRKTKRNRQENEINSISRGPETYKAGIQFQLWVQSWAIEALRVLKPGGYLLAFGGTRTYHRLTCGLEDAGFIIKDTLCWLYGSGFPKSVNISKAFDKSAGVVREVVREVDWNNSSYNLGSNKEDRRDITLPTTDLAKIWDGYGTALKPAYEPIILSQKPLDGTYCQNIKKWQCGALNIDACRIDIDTGDDIHAKNPHTIGGLVDGNIYGSGKETKYTVPAGRFPANIILDKGVAKILDNANNTSQSKPRDVGVGPHYRSEIEKGRWGLKHSVPSGFTDHGGPSRFFYTAKASQKERGRNNNHPTVKPIDIFSYLAKLILPQHKQVVWLDPFLGSGTSAVAATKLNDKEGYQINFIGIDQEEKYIDIAKKRIKDAQKQPSLKFAEIQEAKVEQKSMF